MIARKYKIGIMTILMVAACSFMYYFYVFLGAGTVVSHVFYIPIIVACIWWKRKGLIVAVFSSAFLIVSHIVFRPDAATADDYFRAVMFLVIAFIVAALSEHVAKDQELLRASNQQLQASEQQLRASNQQLQASEQQLRAANQQLDASNQQLRASEEELRKTGHDLAERVKELNCLYGLSQLVERPEIKLEDIFQGLAELIPPAWQYPQITATRIVFEDRSFETANFRQTAWLQSADINVHGRKVGTIEVCYLQERPLTDEGPFLKEERELLDLLARRLGHIVERIRDEEELKAAHQQLLASEQQLKASNQQLQANEQQLRAANQQLEATEQQLRAANQQLEADIVERKKTEARLRAYRRRLRELASELVLAEEHLRRRIARDLHDDVGQELLSVKMRLAELRKGGRASAKRSAALEGIIKSVDRTIQNTRSLLFDLSPPVLYELGFEPAVEWLTEKLETDHGLAAVFEDDGQAKPLTDDLRIGLFRAVRELLVNIVKHAQAKNVKVSARRDGPNIRVEVEDDGVGFDVEQTQIPGDLSNGFGLFDIRERLHHFGGTFQLESKPGQGTRVTLLAPLK